MNTVDGLSLAEATTTEAGVVEPGWRDLPRRFPESAYLRYLPTIYQQDPFLRRFLLIFESVLRPLETAVDNLPLYTEPEVAPDEFVPWLAQWVALALDSTWPLARQRALIANAVEIYRWRGTIYGLKLHIMTYCGAEALVQEYRSGFVLGKDNRLGLTTQLSATPANPLLFVVTVPLTHPKQADAQVLRQIVEENKPAHAVYRLRLVRVSGPRPDTLPIGALRPAQPLRAAGGSDAL
jgi:phage tail-like protein